MSLTNLLSYNNKSGIELREVLAKLFPLPKQKFNQIIKAEPLTQNYALVGTAFDYLLRFTIEKNYKDSQSTKWASEMAVGSLNDNSATTKEILDIKDFETLLEKNKKVHNMIRDRFNNIKETYNKYVNDLKSIDADLLKGCLFLGKLDFLYRRGPLAFYEIDFENEDDKDVQDLNSLINICDISLFKPKNKILLNPTFGEGSSLVNGADADLIVDDLIVDIKVTKELKIKRQYYNQIICYYLLYLIGGINNSKDYKINRLGIYFARYGYLWLINISEIGSIDSFNKVIDILKGLRKNNR